MRRNGKADKTGGDVQKGKDNRGREKGQSVRKKETYLRRENIDRGCPTLGN